MRKLIIFIGGLLVLGLVNFSIWQKEEHLAKGRIVLLELAPVDPRSLMQGDYMRLRFRVVDEAFGRSPKKDLSEGNIIVAIDEKGVGTFRRFDNGTSIESNELRMHYRIRNNEPKFATNAFFFQEGHAKRYERAKFGEFRVSEKGELLLTASS